MTETLPLAGMRIVVTRPLAQAAHLGQLIQSYGGICFQFPLLAITPLADKQPLQDLAKRLHEFNMAIFISPNAVRYGMETLLNYVALPESLQIVTIGKNSAKALHDLGFSRVISPQHQFDSESLLDLPELKNVNNNQVVILRGDHGRELLGDTLKARGALVEYITCYHRYNPQQSAAPLIDSVPDALTISSTEALHNLFEMLSESDKKVLYAIPLFVTHKRISTAAQKLGWRNIITTTGGDEALLQGLTSWAEHNHAKS